MTTRRRRLTSALVLLIALVTTMAGERPADRDDSAPPTPGRLEVVALGDSVTSGGNCNCAAFPSMYGDLLRNRTDAAVSVKNLGLGGQDSTGLLDQLDRSGSPTARATGTAGIVLVTIGANDFGDHYGDITSGQCTGTDCVSGELRQLTTNVNGILRRIHALRDGQSTTILVTGYWNVFEDGDVARRRFPPSGRRATDLLTRQVNEAVAVAARADDATYVDIYTPFEHSFDITNLLAADGDHPNTAGHALIARLLLDATPNRLATGSRQGG